MAKKTDKGGGGKLKRTHMVTIRLDPRLRYLTDLAARTQRRTTSGFIEWAIEKALSQVVLRERHDDDPLTLADEGFRIWDIDEADRFVKLAMNYPNLLTHDEQVLWKLIRESGFLWKVIQDEDRNLSWKINQANINIHELRKHWNVIKDVADGKLDASELPALDEADLIPF